MMTELVIPQIKHLKHQFDIMGNMLIAFLVERS